MNQVIKWDYIKNRLCFLFRRKFLIYLFIFSTLLFLIWFYFALPTPLFSDGTSTVVIDKNEQLLGARIAPDEQWRFAPSDSVPIRFEKCILAFEDRKFYSHLGVSISAIARAIYQNISLGTRVSGASTISMQTIRLMRKNPPRTIREKCLEMILALRLELAHSKKEILNFYCSNAPFGSNVVGLETASWRYFNRPSHRLSWAESATLAVLPNAPGLIFPGRNDAALRKKRDGLLRYLFDQKEMDSTTYSLALLEPLPNRPLPLTNSTPHLLAQLSKEGRNGSTSCVSVDKNVQEIVQKEVALHMEKLAENKIFNAAVVVAHVKTGEVISYVGNNPLATNEQAKHVDCVKAKRSTGSILKPLLYAKAMDEGLITPKSLLIDVPSKFGSFAPKNFANQFSGLIPANEAVSRSLNIPMVHLLRQYGVTKFHSDLKDLGMNSLNKPASHYGLSLILGGAETSLFEITSIYLDLAQQLQGLPSQALHFQKLAIQKQHYQRENTIQQTSLFSMFEAMLDVQRPDEDNLWQLFSSSKKIAWKTGTSFGFRDAWAIGVTPDFVVSVWIGNANGEGRPGLTGIKAAAPLLFSIFNLLPDSKEWFALPSTSKALKICTQSGEKASENCLSTETVYINGAQNSHAICPYHKTIHLNQSETERVFADCYPFDKIKPVSWFILPPHLEKYYQEHHPEYQSPPAFSKNCMNDKNENALVILYPKHNQSLVLPKDFNERENPFVLEAATQRKNTKLYWHINGEYLGETKDIHQLQTRLPEGKHQLTIMDELGARRTHVFTVGS